MCEKEKKHNERKTVDYKDLIPKMTVETPKLDEYYKKAFLERGAVSGNEYSKNTTTWD